MVTVKRAIVNGACDLLYPQGYFILLFQPHSQGPLYSRGRERTLGIRLSLPLKQNGGR